MSKITVGKQSSIFVRSARLASLFANRSSTAGVRTNVQDLLKYSLEEKKRNFLETVELQIGLKNYDPQRGTIST